MIHGLTFKEYVDSEKEKLSEMTKAEKFAYFKEYYFKTCIVIVIGLALLTWFCIDMISSMKHVIVCGGVLNCYITDEGSAFLKEDYMTYLGASEKSNRVDFVSSILLTKEQPESYTMFQAEMAAGTYNYIITDKEGLDYIAKIECISDMNEAMSPELKSRVEANLVYKKYGDTDEEMAAAVDISDTAFAKKYITSKDTVYFVLLGKMDAYQSGLDVLKYILDKQ